jgi:hypothetical protein
MKNFLFNASRILAVILMIGVLSMIGMGNPKAVPLFLLFFIAVFAIIFLLNKYSRQNEREGKAGAGAKPVVQIISVVIFVAIVSILGLLKHGILGFLGWFVVIGAIMFLIYLSIKKRQRHFELFAANPRRKAIVSIIMWLLAIGLPLLLLLSGNLIPAAKENAAMTVIISVVGVLAFIGLISLGLIMVNRQGDNSGKRLLGYILVIIAVILPGIMVLTGSSSSLAFAGAYLAALIAAVLSYFALNMIYKID